MPEEVKKEGCEFCLDPDGECCFPSYGLAPHVHVGEQMIGSTRFTGEVPDNFVPDPEDPKMGSYFCPKCGAGKKFIEESAAAREKMEKKS